MTMHSVERLESWSAPMLFDADFAAWVRSLSPKARAGEAQLQWTDLSPFTISAYGLHLGLIGSYRFLAHRGKGPTTLPDDCTPEGFYLKAIETRRRQIGLHNPFSPTPYERLSNFSHFIYRCMAERVAMSAGFAGRTPSAATSGNDGLDDDGIDDGLSAPESADDGLGGGDMSDSLADGLDDGLSVLAEADDGLGDGL
jgi:hypothetical protein